MIQISTFNYTQEFRCNSFSAIIQHQNYVDYQIQVYSRVETMEMFANTGQLIDNYSQWVHQVDSDESNQEHLRNAKGVLFVAQLWKQNNASQFQMKYHQNCPIMKRRKQKFNKLSISSLSINEIQDKMF